MNNPCSRKLALIVRPCSGSDPRQLIIAGIVDQGLPARINDDSGETLFDDGGPGDLAARLQVRTAEDVRLAVALAEIGAPLLVRLTRDLLRTEAFGDWRCGRVNVGRETHADDLRDLAFAHV